MNKKIWIGAGAVFVIIAVVDFVLNNMLLTKEYENIQSMMRPMAEMKIWLFFVTYAFIAFSLLLAFMTYMRDSGISSPARSVTRSICAASSG